MFGDGALTFREFAMGEPLPRATIHDAVLKFLRGRHDAVLSGAQAVNAYVDESRMTEDVDILSPRARELAEELQAHLNAEFQIAVRIRQLREGIGYRLDQLRNPRDRHLIDVRSVESLPSSQRVSEVLVVTPDELIACKVIALAKGRGKPKAGIDWRDVAMLLLTFPELKSDAGPVRERLEAAGASESMLATWKDLVAQEILPEDEDAKFS